MHRAGRLLGCALGTRAAPHFRVSTAVVTGATAPTAATAWSRPLGTTAAATADGGSDGGGDDHDDGGANGNGPVGGVPAVPEADYGSSLNVDDGDAEAVRQQVEADAAREAEDNPAKNPADAAADVGGDGSVYNGAAPGKS
ncbi:hypothetical protein MMPV_002140 [Pyropia vietnamensis]